MKISSEMSPNTPTLRRSPRSPGLAGYLQGTDPNIQYHHRSSHSTSRGSQRNSVSSSALLTMSPKARQVATRRSSRAGSRQSSSSGGLVSLPGAGTSALLGDEFDFNIDPALLLGDIPEFDESFFDDLLASGAFELKGTDATHVPASNVNVTNAETINSRGQLSSPGLQHGLGLDLVPVNSSQQEHQAPLYTAPTDSQWDANLALDSQYNDFHTDSLEPSTGLSALPNGTYFQPQPSAGHQQHVYPSPRQCYPTQPYYLPRVPVIEQTGYTPYEHPHAEPPQQAQYGFAGLYPSRHCSREKFKSFQQNQKWDWPESSSDEDAPTIKRRRRKAQPEFSPKSKAQRDSSRSDESRRQSSIFDSGSLSRPVKVSPIRVGQKPKKPEDKSWVRINSSTKGETTRTARINKFTDIGTKYKHHPLPIGNWQSSSGFKFEYTHHFGMDEFKKQSMSARQIHEYITDYPSDYLRIWIQLTPGDSARRYASEPHSRCIFEQCPNRKWGGKATIEVGTYRVAFDEKHKKYGKGVCDPFDCVGYAHLYCMERFLDFAGICETADVKVDDRSGLDKEPKAVAGFSFLNNRHMYDKLIAEKFIKAAQAGALDCTPEFRDYPNHCDYARGQPKPHDKTLVAALYEANLSQRTRSQIKQFVNRKIQPGAFPIHRGDQEMANLDKMVTALPLYRSNVEAGVHGAGDLALYYDRFFPLANKRINDCVALRAKFKREDDEGIAPTRARSKKRRITAEESDDDSEDRSHGNNNLEKNDTYPVRQPSPVLRSSPRKKQRVNYVADPLSEEQHDIFSKIPQLLPQYNAQAPPQPQTSPTKAPTQAHPISPSRRTPNLNPSPPGTRNNSCSQFFANNPDVLPFDFSTLDNLSPNTSTTTPTNLSPLLNLDPDLDPALHRRKSSSLSTFAYTSILKSPRKQKHGVLSPLATRAVMGTARNASFEAQPVSSSKRFRAGDPPSHVAERAAAAAGAGVGEQGGRRSRRIASLVGGVSPRSVGRGGRRCV
ncbi:hypothetical protein J1614_007003 [Plenodomus biglobosus]|nr:hypothetical protein J1614_007003 [Plenodomus biglobosus]